MTPRKGDRLTDVLGITKEGEVWRSEAAPSARGASQGKVIPQGKILPHYKVHCARFSHYYKHNYPPLQVLVNDPASDWEEWNSNAPLNNLFNRNFIISLARIYKSSNTWLFGGVFAIDPNQKATYTATNFRGHPVRWRYHVVALRPRKQYDKRIVVHLPYRGRTTRINPEQVYNNSAYNGNQRIYQIMRVKEYLSAPAKADWDNNRRIIGIK